MPGARPAKATVAILCAGLAAFLLSGVALAADPPEATMLHQWTRSGRLTIAIAQGRLSIGTRQPFGGTSSTSSGGQRTEKLSMQAPGPDVTLEYELSVPTETYSVDVKADRSVLIRRRPKGSSAAPGAEYVQEAGKGVVLKVGSEANPTVYEAPSIWHLALAEPGAVGEHLIPMLKPLVQDADLVTTAGALEERLLQMAASQRPPDRERWAALVAQLGEEKYARREAADRALREAGPGVLAFLRNLDSVRLDAEQRFRVRRIVMSMSKKPESDTVETVAEWMLTDAKAWFILLGRDQESTRRVAAQRLEVLLGQPTGFDAAAPPAVRAQQIERLRPRVVGPKTEG